MLRRHPLLIFSCLALLAAAPWARRARAGEEFISADTAWQRVDQKSGVVLYERKRAGGSIKEFKGTGLINAPPAVVERVLEDVGKYTEFMPYVGELRVISQTADQIVTYQRLDLPFVTGRDYTIRVEHGIIHGPGGELLYRDTWQTDNEEGPPERHGLVRVKVNEGSWLLEPSGADGNTTQATYQIYTDSGGVLPAFLANKASQMAIPKLFDALRKEVAKAGK